jgi:hypothetical protein
VVVLVIVCGGVRENKFHFGGSIIGFVYFLVFTFNQIVYISGGVHSINQLIDQSFISS